MAYVEKRGELQWRVQVRKKGFPLFSQTFEAHKDAVGWGKDLESAIGRRDLAEVRRLTGTAPADARCVADLVDRYVNEVLPPRRVKGTERPAAGTPEAKRERAADNVRPRLARIRADLGKLALGVLGGPDIAQWRNDRLVAGSSAQTVRHDLATLSTLLQHAVSEWGVAVTNVVRDVRKPSLARGRDRRLSTEEFGFLIRSAREARPGTPPPSRGLAPLLILAVETSMRQGELVALRWPDIDLAKRVAQVRESKNGEGRSVALSTAACGALRELQAVRRLDGRVFDWTDPHSVARPFRRAVERAKELYLAERLKLREKPDPKFLEDLRFHDIRHEATSRLFEKGLNPMEVASMTGHKSMQMLRRYTHVEAAKVAAKLG